MKVKLILETDTDSHQVVISKREELIELYGCINENRDVYDYPNLYIFGQWMSDELYPSPPKD